MPRFWNGWRSSRNSVSVNSINAATLEHCLNKLLPAQRQLIDLRYVDGQAIERIAESIGRPVGSIRQTLFRIRSALLNCIEQSLAMGGAES